MACIHARCRGRGALFEVLRLQRILSTGGKVILVAGLRVGIFNGMRLSQPKGESPKFAEMLGETLREIHPDYAQNKSAKGIRIEFLREVIPGVHASHHALCWKGTYKHGFCITLHRELPTPYFDSPFTAGGRFDRDRTINRSVWIALGQHVVLSDSHEFRKGCERIIARCTSEAERILLPHYLAVFQRSREALAALAGALYGDVPIQGESQPLQCSGFPIGDMDSDMEKFARQYEQSRHRSAEFLREVLDSKPDFFQRLREKNSISLASLA